MGGTRSGLLAGSSKRSKLLARPWRDRVSQARAGAHRRAELAAFRSGLRRRYSDEDILKELPRGGRAARAVSDDARVRERLRGRCTRRPSSSTSAPGTPRSAPRASTRRFLTRDELLEQLPALSDELGRIPMPAISPLAAITAVGLSSTRTLRIVGVLCARPATRFSGARSGSNARSSRAHGSPRAGAASQDVADWAASAGRDAGSSLRVAGVPPARRPRGAWTAFQFLVRERLREEGVEVRADGTLEVWGLEQPRAQRRRRHGRRPRGARHVGDQAVSR